MVILIIVSGIKYLSTNFIIFSFVGIYFVQLPPKEGKEIDVLFSFDIKPPKQIILCACLKGEWKKEVVLEDEDISEKLFEKPFELSIIPIAIHDEVGSEILVFVNNEFITTFQCSSDITITKYIGFSKTFRICANINDFII